MTGDSAGGRACPDSGSGRRTVVQVLLGAPAPVWILVFGVFLNRAGAFFSTFLTLFLRDIGFTLDQTPLILFAVGIAMPVGSFAGGWVSDRVGRKASLVGATLLAAACFLVIGLAPNREIALAGVFSASFFAQAYLPAATALLVDHTAEQDRVPTFALFRLALNLGAALGPLLAAFVVSAGVGPLFLVSSASSATFALVLLVGLRGRAGSGSPAADRSGGAPGGGRAGPRAPAGLAFFFGAVLLATAVYAQYSSSVSLSVTDKESASLYAAMLTMSGALIIVGEIPLSAFTRRLPWHIPIVAGTIAMAAGIALAGSASGYVLIAAGVVVWTAGEMLFSPVVNSAVAALSPAGKVGRYQGYLTTVQAVAFSMGPAAGTWAYGRSPGLLWTMCLLAGVLAGVGFLLGRRASQRAGAAADASAEASAT